MNAPFTLDYEYAQQNKEELDWLLRRIAGSESILEVGSCYGQTLKAMTRVCVKGASIRSIDLGYGLFSLEGVDTGEVLRGVVSGLLDEGFDAQVHLADSKSDDAVAWAERWAPYDFVFIDGDHDYEGVKSDWEKYGTMGRMVGFHDIYHPTHGVAKLWNEIKKTRKTDSYRFAFSDMGIGIVSNDSP